MWQLSEETKVHILFLYVRPSSLKSHYYIGKDSKSDRYRKDFGTLVRLFAIN